MAALAPHGQAARSLDNYRIGARLGVRVLLAAGGLAALAVLLLSRLRRRPRGYPPGGPGAGSRPWIGRARPEGPARGWLFRIRDPIFAQRSP